MKFIYLNFGSSGRQKGTKIFGLKIVKKLGSSKFIQIGTRHNLKIQNKTKVNIKIMTAHGIKLSRLDQVRFDA